ncbi:MAG: hypothetical protein WBA57_09120 [Elainellaceae cyanobacterium]
MKELYSLLSFANREQRANLSKLINAGFGDSPQSLCDHLKFLRAGAIGQVCADPSWKQIVTDVADHIRIDWQATLEGRSWRELPTQDIENAVVKALFSDLMAHLSPQQQRQVVLQMKGSTQNTQLDALLSTGGVMAAARMSGFGVYIMASTVLGGLTHAVGMTLPFSSYLGMSQAIALVLGPVGWVALAGGMLHSHQSHWEKLTRAVAYVAVIRASQEPSCQLFIKGDWDQAIAFTINGRSPTVRANSMSR